MIVLFMNICWYEIFLCFPKIRRYELDSQLQSCGSGSGTGNANPVILVKKASIFNLDVNSKSDKIRIDFKPDSDPVIKIWSDPGCLPRVRSESGFVLMGRIRIRVEIEWIRFWPLFRTYGRIPTRIRPWYFNKTLTQNTLRTYVHVREIVREILRVKQW